MNRRALLLTGLLGILACGDSFSPSTQSVAGAYTATVLTTTTGGVTTDQLAAGSSLTLMLTSGGTTTGQLVAPDESSGGNPVTLSLAGTWSLTGDQVTFAQSADTFLRDMTFTAAKDQLRGDGTFSGTRIQVTLRRNG